MREPHLERYVAGGNERVYLILPKAVPEPGTEISVNWKECGQMNFCDTIPNIPQQLEE